MNLDGQVVHTIGYYFSVQKLEDIVLKGNSYLAIWP